MKINDVEFTPQEIECIRIALDAYGDEQEKNSYLQSEVDVARSTREKFRKVTQ